MTKRIVSSTLLAGLLCSSIALAQQPSAPANPLDVVPEKMPFDIPYGAPISLERANKAIAAAQAEAGKRGWKMNIAVSDSGANLVAFTRMDGAMLAGADISIHKSRTAAKFRRDIKIFENGVQSGLNGLLSLDDVIVNRGGIPLIENGAVIGAIGVSGGTGSQDEVIAKAGVAAINP
jgi:glc operon protein GlcG